MKLTKIVIFLISIASAPAFAAFIVKPATKTDTPAAAVAPVAKVEPEKTAEPAETSFGSDSGLPALKAETKAPAVVTAPAAKAVPAPAPGGRDGEEKPAVADRLLRLLLKKRLWP